MKNNSSMDPLVARIGAGAWLVVPAAFALASVLDRTRPWEGSPRIAWLVGWAALMLAGVLLLVTMLSTKVDAPRTGLTRAGIGFVVLGLAASVVAGWAIPLWTTLYGIGLTLYASGTRPQPVARFMGASFLAATLVHIVLTMLEVGRPDTYGDYPVAWTTAYFVGALGAALGMALWPSSSTRAEVEDHVLAH